MMQCKPVKLGTITCPSQLSKYMVLKFHTILSNFPSDIHCKHSFIWVGYEVKTQLEYSRHRAWLWRPYNLAYIIIMQNFTSSSFKNAIIEVISFWIHYEERSSWWIKSFDVGYPSLRLRERYLVQPGVTSGHIEEMNQLWTRILWPNAQWEKDMKRTTKLSGLLMDILSRDTHI